MQLIKNYFLYLASIILQIVSPLITIPYVTRIFSPELMGIASYSGSIAKWFLVFASLGTSMYATKAIASSPEDQRKAVFTEIFTLNLILTSIVTVLYLLWILIYNQNSTLFLIQGLILVVYIFDIGWYFSGIQNFKVGLLRNLITRLLSIGLIFAFVHTPNDLTTYILIQVGVLLFSALLVLFQGPGFNYNIPRKTFSAHLFQHCKKSLLLFLPILAINVYTVFDKILLGKLSTPKELGLYDSCAKVITLLMIFSTSSAGVLMPKIAQMISQNQDWKKYVKYSFEWAHLTAFILFVWILIFNQTFVSLFFGSNYNGVSNLLLISMPLMFFLSWSNITGFQLMIPLGLEKKLALSVILAACTNIAFGLLLIPKLGSQGSTYAWVVTEGVTSIIQLYFIRHIHSPIQIIKSLSIYLIPLGIWKFGFYLFPFVPQSISHQIYLFVVILILTLITLSILRKKQAYELIQSLRSSR